MQSGKSKIEPELKEALDKLEDEDEDEIEALIFPKKQGGEIERLLQAKKKAGELDYNVLLIANCIAIKASKKFILELASRDDVIRLSANPKFTAQQSR
jgi:hypothetical protein